MKLGNLSSYKILNSQVFFCLFISTFEILSNLPIVICSCFKMQLLRVLRLRNAYILRLADVFICCTLLLGFILNACSKVYIHFACYFVLRCEFVVVLLKYMGTPRG